MMTQPGFAILLVDDEQEVLDGLAADVEGYFGDLFQIETCLNGQEACEVAAELAAEQILIPVIICDYVMPGMNGIDLLIYFSQHGWTQASKRILLSGQASYENVIRGVNESAIDRCLAKPWTYKTLIATLRVLITEFMVLEAPDQVEQYQHKLSRTMLSKALVTTVRQRGELQGQLATLQQTLLDYPSSAETLSQCLLNEIKVSCQQVTENDLFQTYPSGTTLLTEGVENHLLRFIIRGEVVHKKQLPEGKRIDVMTEGAGTALGIMSLLSGQKTFTSIHAVSEVELVVLDKSSLEHLLATSTPFLTLFNSMLLRQLHRRVKRTVEMKIRIQETLIHLEATQLMLAESEKMATLGQLVAGIAHELNNPTAAIVRGVDHLKTHLPALLTSPPSTFSTACDFLPDLGLTVLTRAMGATPLSTAETRVRTKAATVHFQSTILAKKAVQLQLDDADSFQRYFVPLGEEMGVAIQYLDHYYQVGNFLHHIDRCGQRVAALVKSLKNYARQDTETVATVDLHQGLEETLMIFGNRLKVHQLIREYDALPLLFCRPAELNQVWTNLIGNALDAMKVAGTLRVKTQHLTDPTACIEVSIEDNGVGIPLAQQAQVFDLHFTTKRGTGFGLGIGLAISQQIIRRHGGSLTVSSTPGEKTCFTAILPLLNPALKKLSRADE